MQSRPPIVVIMGHIDHGKTTLLDYIRKSSVASSEVGPPSVAAGEAGGITQHIGAYEVDHPSTGSGQVKKITFLDTPGHEAFAKMRSRGAKVADIAILVVAADDGVKPQTKEALETIKNAKIPFVVAINKIDRPAADLEKVKNELATEQVFLEGRGGTVPYAEISAKQGIGIDHLLEVILLLAEMESIAADPKSFASGLVIESHRDSKRGVTSTLLIINGTLKKGEYVVAGEAVAKVRILENFKGEVMDSAGPSQPAVVVGFDKTPQVGAEFKTFFAQKDALLASLASAGKNASQKQSETKTTKETPSTILGLVVKTDVLGSAEAILHEIEKLKNEKLELKILRAGAGDLSEDDIKTVMERTSASKKHAKEILQMGQEQLPLNGALDYYLGHVANATKQPELAVQHYTDAQEHAYPRADKIHYYRGLVYQNQLKDHAQAKQDFESFLKSNTTDTAQIAEVKQHLQSL